jgi:hypothetical protein
MPQKRKSTARAKESRPVKTTLELPEDLWRAARIRALDERTNLKALIVRGLELVLAQPPKK